MAPRRSIPPPSPARSTRSTRRDNDEDWEGQSVTSKSVVHPLSLLLPSSFPETACPATLADSISVSSFRALQPRHTGEKDLSILGLKDTSVKLVP